MASDAVLRGVNVVHRRLVRWSGGRVGGRLKGMPVLQLTTTGRRSGEPRTVMLTSPLQHDGAYVVVGSRGGDDVHPAWYLNLRAEPAVTVQVGGGPATPMRARVLEGDERAATWAEVTERYPHYAGYQRRTERQIPLVALEPA